jgi:hypothetical protein
VDRSPDEIPDSKKRPLRPRCPASPDEPLIYWGEPTPGRLVRVITHRFENHTIMEEWHCGPLGNLWREFRVEEPDAKILCRDVTLEEVQAFLKTHLERQKSRAKSARTPDQKP